MKPQAVSSGRPDFASISTGCEGTAPSITNSAFPASDSVLSISLAMDPGFSSAEG